MDDLKKEEIEEVITRTDDPDGGDSPSEGDPEGPSPLPTGEDAIAFMEMANTGVVVALAKVKRLPLTQEIMALTRFSEEEKEQLRPYAPFAAPYLHGMSKYSEKFMALAFLGLSVMTINTRIKDLSVVLQMAQADNQERKRDEERVMKPEAWIKKEDPKT